MRTLLLSAAAGILVTAGLMITFPDAGGGAFAQSRDTCLRNNRIWSTGVVDDRTLVVNDRSGQSFVVELSGGCQGLVTNFGPVRFNTRTSLGCLGPGDRVAFRHRTLGRNTCFVRNVHTDLASLPRGGSPAFRTARATR